MLSSSNYKDYSIYTLKEDIYSPPYGFELNLSPCSLSSEIHYYGLIFFYSIACIIFLEKLLALFIRLCCTSLSFNYSTTV